MNNKIINTALVLLVMALTALATWWMDGHGSRPPQEKIQQAAADSASSAVKVPPALSPGTARGKSFTASARAPLTTLRTLAGDKIMLQDFEGKIILLNFWATWCTPCIAEWPQFIRLARALPDDVVILAVSIDDDKAKIAPFMKRYASAYAQHKNIMLFHDADKSVSQDLFQTVRVPETIIITPDMTMARKVAGLGLEWDSEDTITYLQALKNHQP